MNQQTRSSGAAGHDADGWAVFSYLFGGVIVYGLLGWLLDRWLGTAYFLPIGVLGGMAGALYLVYARFWHFPSGPDGASRPDATKGARG